MRDTRVATHHEPRRCDQRKQGRERRTAGQHTTGWQTGLGGDAYRDWSFRNRAGDHHLVPVRGQDPRHHGKSLGRPAATGMPSAGMDDHRVRYQRRFGQRLQVEVIATAPPPKRHVNQSAPTLDFMLVNQVLRTVWKPRRAGVRYEPLRLQPGQELVTLWALAMQVYGDRGRIASPRQATEVTRGENSVDSSHQVNHRRQGRRSGEYEVVIGQPSPQPAQCRHDDKEVTQSGRPEDEGARF
jgi:hypothetical protein